MKDRLSTLSAVTFRRALLRTTSLVAGTIALPLLLAAPLAAQAHFGQPIYPAYQGWAPNPDGSFTMVFQYFSHNRDPVTVPAGDANQFNGVADRNQPTTFLPGNHEFVCVMVAKDAADAEALRWSVAFPDPGKPSVTSEVPLHREYRLELRSEENAQRDIDLAKAPRGVCLNKPPRVTVSGLREPEEGAPGDGAGTVRVVVGKETTLRATINDEGLPRGSSVTSSWSVLSGPAQVTIANTARPSTRATFPAAGTYVLEIKATDGELERAVRFEVEAHGSESAANATN